MIKDNSFETKKAIAVIVVFVCGMLQGFAQPEADSLFSSEAPLDIRLNISVNQVKDSKKDTSWLSDKLYYRNSSGSYDSIKIDLKGRGHYRLNECYFPPLWIKIKKKAARGTPFEGNKKLKLVLPCNTARGDNPLIIREFLCYKLCEAVTPYAFKTRLVNIDLTETEREKEQKFPGEGNID